MLLTVSGITMVVYDAGIIQRGYRWLRPKTSKNQPDIEKNQSKTLKENEEPVTAERPVTMGEPFTMNDEINEIREPNTQEELDAMNEKVNNSKASKTQEELNTEDIERGAIELYELELNDIIPYSLRTGWIVLGCFIISLIVIMVLRGIIHVPILRFFSNMYLAGTIICGGGFDLDLLC